jgi:hypothetical protein
VSWAQIVGFIDSGDMSANADAWVAVRDELAEAGVLDD